VCIQDRCDDTESAWTDPGVYDCSVSGMIQIPGYREVLFNATKFVTDAPTDISNPIYSPVRIPEHMWDVGYHTSSTFLFNFRDGTLIGWVRPVRCTSVTRFNELVQLRWAIASISGLTCLLAGVRHLYLHNRIRVSHFLLSEGPSIGRSSVLSVFTKKWVLMPALVGRTNAMRPSVFGLALSVPTRLQSILIAFYIGLNAVGLGVRYDLFTENVYWPNDIRTQITRYLSDRAGILSFA
jgi:hypothetical protein